MPMGAHGTGTITKSTTMIVPAVNHIVVNMAASYGAVFYGTQRKTSPIAIPAFVLIPAISYAIMHMTASKRTIINLTDGNHSLLNLCTLSAASAMASAMSVGRNGQQANGNNTCQTGKKDFLDPHRRFPLSKQK